LGRYQSPCHPASHKETVQGYTITDLALAVTPFCRAEIQIYIFFSISENPHAITSDILLFIRMQTFITSTELSNSNIYIHLHIGSCSLVVWRSDKSLGFMFKRSYNSISVPPSAVPASPFYCLVILSAQFCDDTLKCVTCLLVNTYHYVTFFPPPYIFCNHFILDSSNNWETIRNNERNPTEKTERFVFAASKLRLIYKLFVTR